MRMLAVKNYWLIYRFKGWTLELDLTYRCKLWGDQVLAQRKWLFCFKVSKDVNHKLYISTFVSSSFFSSIFLKSDYEDSILNLLQTNLAATLELSSFKTGVPGCAFNLKFFDFTFSVSCNFDSTTSEIQKIRSNCSYQHF